MSDKELRGVVLREFYNRRRQGPFQWAELADVPGMPEIDDLISICDQLLESGLIQGKALKGGGGEVIGGIGRIAAIGIDVIEHGATPPIPIALNIDQSTITIQSSNNVQIGNHNVQDVTLSLEKIITAIDKAQASPAEKKEAKSLLRKFCENPLVLALAPGLVETAGRWFGGSK